MEKKTLILLGGTMGSGKTTVGQCLKEQLPNSVFLDGDWCWDANPFTVNDETKAMVLDNITHLLNNFLKCSAYQYVIFAWVMDHDKIIASITEKLDLCNVALYSFSLVVAPDVLMERLQKDIKNHLRSSDVISRSIARLPLYQKMSTIQIDVSVNSPEEIAQTIIQTTQTDFI